MRGGAPRTTLRRMNSAAAAPPHLIPVPPGVRIARLSTLELGRLGEDLAADHLARAGWQVIDRNVRVGRGELDIIALEGTTLVFAEVKTRRTLLTGVPQAAVTPEKVRRLRRLAGEYLLHSSPPHRDLRIDVLAVFAAQDVCSLEHLRAVA
ncbi:YraN family protein [Brachybacterium phenoliresistens]